MSDGMVVSEKRSPVHFAGTLLSLLLFLATGSKGLGSECPRPPSVPHSWVNLTETNKGFFPLGTVLQYGCDQGFTVDGPSIISCTASGRWSSDPPRCVRTDVCRPPFTPENGGYTCHPSPCHRLISGTVIEYFCDEGYALKGDYKYLTCQNGEWDSPMQISCRLSQGKEVPSQLGIPTLSIVASTASSVALILLLIVLFVLLQPKLKSFHHSRREQGVTGQPVSIVVEGVQVSLPSYEEAVYGSGGTFVPPPESRVQIVLSEGPQAEGPARALGEDATQAECSLPSTSSLHSEMVLVHQIPSSTSSGSTPSSSSWVPEQRLDSDSSDQHSLLSLASAEDCADDIPLLKEA
ncbi:sushi domain-containing protein 6 [Scleropages formosus]|uniref:Sushi domain containing 6 n=1 Tax=Scleropages formosus TaxID=113540 RepID=A0A8C9V6K8_SCLFO|nr:sushi domain-containing protein 6 [Scleropages formosus]